jgi:hypothetical protein
MVIASQVTELGDRAPIDLGGGGARPGVCLGPDPRGRP